MDTKENLLLNYLRFLEKQPKGFVYHETTPPKPEPSALERTTTPLNQSTDLSGDCQQKRTALATLYKPFAHCQQCPLGTLGRTQVVFGTGTAEAELMFVGEGPGRDEDLKGVPFIGRAGQLLTKIIEAMCLKRDDVYISNVVKCRPPENRTPLPLESVTCKSLLLFKEIEIIQPKIICALGAVATQALLGPEVKISGVRGTFCDFRGIPVMPTYHPAYLLRNPDAKRIVWEDMQKIMARLENK